MKKMLLLFILISGFAFGQNENDSINFHNSEVENSYREYLEKYKKYIKYDAEIERTISAMNEFRPTYSKLLALNDLSNKDVQKALIADYAGEYYDLFNGESEGKKINVLLYGFDNRDDFEKYVNYGYYFLMNKTNIQIADRLISNFKNEMEKEEIYINKNLKRLGIKRIVWDEMSENDKDILWEKFKN